MRQGDQQYAQQNLPRLYYYHERLQQLPPSLLLVRPLFKLVKRHSWAQMAMHVSLQLCTPAAGLKNIQRVWWQSSAGLAIASSPTLQSFFLVTCRAYLQALRPPGW